MSEDPIHVSTLHLVVTSACDNCFCSVTISQSFFVVLDLNSLEELLVGFVLFYLIVREPYQCLPIIMLKINQNQSGVLQLGGTVMGMEDTFIP